MLLNQLFVNHNLTLEELAVFYKFVEIYDSKKHSAEDFIHQDYVLALLRKNSKNNTGKKLFQHGQPKLTKIFGRLKKENLIIEEPLPKYAISKKSSEHKMLEPVRRGRKPKDTCFRPNTSIGFLHFNIRQIIDYLAMVFENIQSHNNDYIYKENFFNKKTEEELLTGFQNNVFPDYY